MVAELRRAEVAVGYLSAICAFILLWMAALGGPQLGCPVSGTATGLCAMDWSYQTANAVRRAAYMLVGFVILTVGSFMITRRGGARPKTSLPRKVERRFEVAIVVLALLGIVLLVAAVAVGFTMPPTRTLTFTNSQLPSVGDFLEAYYGTERAATVYLIAGEAIMATATVDWYASGSTTPQYGGPGGFGPNIVPAGQPLVYNGAFANWFVVPRTGAYTIYFDSMYPDYATSYTSNASMTITAYNVDFPPMIQLALASLGGVLFAAAVGVDWVVHPRIRLRRSTLEVPQEKGPPLA